MNEGPFVRVLLRADASPQQGTGHVMRSLTLAEGLHSRGHDVHLLTNDSGIPWLETVISKAPVLRHFAEQHQFAQPTISEIAPDWIVVDSYLIPETEINGYQGDAKILAIVDGDDRGIKADLFVDHNLGAETLPWSEFVRNNLLAGNRYALVRDSILSQRRERPWEIVGDKPHVLAFMGGSDPTGAICLAAQTLALEAELVDSTLIASNDWQDQVSNVIAGNSNISVLAPTPLLPELLGGADISISAAGTSAWELCTLGIPSVLLAVVDNQDESLERLVAGGFALGVKREEMTVEFLQQQLNALIQDETLREEISKRCLASFDGQGKNRVVEAMERLQKSSIG